jgi:hypothetical protein
LGWVLLTARGFDHHKYWQLSAWELEKRYLRDTVPIVSNLQPLSKGGRVQFEEVGETLALGPLSKKSQRWVAYRVIVVFAIVFMISIVYDILVLFHVL